jgi:hypothetical protein
MFELPSGQQKKKQNEIFIGHSLPTAQFCFKIHRMNFNLGESICTNASNSIGFEHSSSFFPLSLGKNSSAVHM